MKLSAQTLFRERPMKFTLWVVFALIAASWSVAVYISAEFTKWLAASVSWGKPGELITNAGDWPVPAWLSMWIAPALIESFQVQWVQVLGWLGQTGPSLEGVVSWLIPLIWVIWGAVTVIGLLVAVAGHFLIGKLCRSNRLAHSS
jgi:hypothetical protein